MKFRDRNRHQDVKVARLESQLKKPHTFHSRTVDAIPESHAQLLTVLQDAFLFIYQLHAFQTEHKSSNTKDGYQNSVFY